MAVHANVYCCLTQVGLANTRLPSSLANQWSVNPYCCCAGTDKYMEAMKGILQHSGLARIGL